VTTDQKGNFELATQGTKFVVSMAAATTTTNNDARFSSCFSPDRRPGYGVKSARLVSWTPGSGGRKREKERTTNENTSTESTGVGPLSCTLSGRRENGPFSVPGVTSRIMADPDRLQCLSKTPTPRHRAVSRDFRHKPTIL
jgi:hypothetical protein